MAIPRDDWVGQMLSGGRYRVSSRLGEGGMGFVYKAWDRNIEADVVVKVPRRSMLEQADFADRFSREIRSLVRLSHPQIVKVSDVGEHEGLPFAVMQYLPGGDLEERRPVGPDGQPGPSRPGSLAGWLPGVASALDYIHREGFIHRDVKPANILFDGQGHPFLGDFGVAKVLGAVEASAPRGGALTGVGVVMGTPEYMAPELVMGRPFDGRVDQYALAVTAYEMLCGRKPFEGESATAILVRQANQEPPPLVGLKGRGADELARLVLKGLAKDPAGRFASCGEFARAVVAAAAMVDDPKPLETAKGPVDRLRCPACAKDLPIPAAVLAAPEKARGRRTNCPACKTPLRFAGEGLGLVLDKPSGERSGATMIAMGTTPEPAAPPRFAPTMRVESPTRPGPARAASTVKVDAPTDLGPGRSSRTVKLDATSPAPTASGEAASARPARTVKIEATAESIPARPAGTVKMSSILPEPDFGADPGPAPRNWTIPVAVALFAVALMVAAGYFTLGSKREPTLARLDPPAKVAPPAATGRTNPPVKREVTPPSVAVPPQAPAPAKPDTPPSPPAPQPVAPTPPDPAPAPARPERPDEVPAKLAAPEPRKEVPPAEPEIPEPAEDLSKLLVATLDDVAGEPEKYVGHLVLPTELLMVGGSLGNGPGPYRRLSVERVLTSNRKAPPTRSPIPIVATREVASHIREATSQYLPSSQSYPAIADLRIVKGPSAGEPYLAVVERIEFFRQHSDREIFYKHWGKAFQVALATPTGAELTLGRGDEWRKRFDPAYLNQVGRAFKSSVAQRNGAVFDRIWAMSAREAAEANKIIQGQYNDMMRRAWGR